MSKCKCSLREKSLGDGCQYCNPQMLIDIQADEIAELQDRIDELEKALNVTDISEYREPHSVINTGEAVHVIPTSVVKHIQVDGIREMAERLRITDEWWVSRRLVEEYADKLEKGE